MLHGGGTTDRNYQYCRVALQYQYMLQYQYLYVIPLLPSLALPVYRAWLRDQYLSRVSFL